MRSNFREIEAALIICSENPQVVASQIAGLTSIANYRLLPQNSETIHDLYLDRPDRALQTQELALRLREMGVAQWITLKGRSQPTGWGGVERLEIEAPWSQDALTSVVKELMDRRIKMLPQRQDFDYAHPLNVLMSLGLEVIQDRRSYRVVRNIVPMGEESSPVPAELAIDAVVYHFSGQETRLHEVEIEAKVEDGSAVLNTMIKSLLAMYGQTLRTWDHGKLPTGKAIEKLLREGALEGLLDDNNNLKPMAYYKIDSYLKSGSS